jgi:hypothetical protein
VIATPEDDNDYVKALDADYQSEYCSSDAWDDDAEENYDNYV